MSTLPADYARTLRSLHGVAELLLAGPQYLRSGTIRLAPAPGGFATVTAPEIAVSGGSLLVGGVTAGAIAGSTCVELAAAVRAVLAHSAQGEAVSGVAETELATGAMAGTAGAELAAGAELEGAVRESLAAAVTGFAASAPAGVYRGGSDVGADEVLVCDPAAAQLIAETFAIGAHALATVPGADAPVLWPEHFDLSITVSEINFGVSPGDSTIPEPYAYVGPWTPRSGAFWNQAFGAARTLTELGDATNVADFFAEGIRLAGA
ncbi:hypothetical protein [Nocardia stercoris]|uniref:Uncharacterized protein n=1 Tax=Nocardia stercoris TaxID=2483361 RepID=A0A3M2L2S4_9NOCA|nr:hypothetical protein [Nocardia stercoris]RMI30823.1 hypothetical protein EBN03_19385 [Nocardia stercoris]